MMAQNEMEMRRQRGGGRGQMPMMPMQMAADTAITNHLDLEPEQMQKIEELNQNYAETFKTLMQQARPKKGNRLNKEEREAMMQQVNTVRDGARRQLREVLGDDKYIAYLEQQLDNQQRNAMVMHGGNRGGQMPRGGFGGGPMGGFGGPGMGGFDGGQMGGFDY